jgi:hypothetical protein
VALGKPGEALTFESLARGKGAKVICRTSGKMPHAARQPACDAARASAECLSGQIWRLLRQCPCCSTSTANMFMRWSSMHHLLMRVHACTAGQRGEHISHCGRCAAGHQLHPLVLAALTMAGRSMRASQSARSIAVVARRHSSRAGSRCAHCWSTHAQLLRMLMLTELSYVQLFGAMQAGPAAIHSGN